MMSWTWFSTALGIVPAFVSVLACVFLHASNSLSAGFVNSAEHSGASSLLRSGVRTADSDLCLCRGAARRYKLAHISPGGLCSPWARWWLQGI